MISTRVHGAIDYLSGLILIASPFLLGFADGGPAQWVPILLGAATLVYSLLTDYEFGVAHLIPVRTHLALDMAGGALLAASPWVFGFADRIWWPHLLAGIVYLVVPMLTRSKRAGSRRA